MKKTIKLFGAIILGSFLLTSCKSIQVPKYASVENVIDLKLNSSLKDVINTLGSKPYNVYLSQNEGYTIYTYKYKAVERKINPRDLNKIGSENNGQEVYKGKEHTLFLMFKDNKLESFITSEGRDDADALLMFNNTVQAISSDKAKYILVPGSSSSSDVIPTNSKKKKKFLFF